MKKQIAVIFFLAGLFNTYISGAQNVWQNIDPSQLPAATQTIHPLHYLVYTVDEAALKLRLATLPGNPDEGQIIELPMPDGTLKNFRAWKSSIMPDELANRYPELMTFTAEEVGNRNVTAKLDFTVYGFHAMVFDGNNTSFIDPYNRYHDGNYLVHYKRDETRPLASRSKCIVHSDDAFIEHKAMHNEQRVKQAQRTSNGYQLRTYRLALSADNSYCQAATGLTNPTIAQAFSAMTTTINRVNGVYEREFSISMVFVAKEDTLIWPSAVGSVNGPDPFSLIDNLANPCLDTNQAVCDRRIGDPNYDIGHVFTTGAGGLSQIGVACSSRGDKAQSVTGQPDPVGDGFDIDYVSHEMGHEYGSDHCFNNNIDHSCNGNAVSDLAYEPGSGSTIMCYAGICGPDDLQPHSDAYFSAPSMELVQQYITAGGDLCPVKTPTNNKPVSIPSFRASYIIPYKTPFELTAPAATDSVNDTSVTYCWEQYNLGDFGAEFINTHYYGPIFRSYSPTKSPTRVFPNMSMVLTDTLSNVGTENHESEKVPDVQRFLTFRLALRDIYQGNGCFLIPDDTVHIDVTNTVDSFTVTSQNAPGTYYIGNSPETITWNVSRTNVSPINTANVDIFMSVDGGNTWRYHIGTFPNSGSAIVILPNPDVDVHTARIKVKGNNNVFFNVNSTDFTVTHSLSSDTAIVIYPIPAHDILRMYGGTMGILNGVIYNAVGQEMWKGQIDGETDISVSSWARGIYFVKLIDVKNRHTVKKIVVE